jgi:glycosyltransferase involved in cell wall biosynthesis
MNILYILNSGNPGGMEQHVLDLIKGMVKHGHKVYVWCTQGQISDWYKNAGAVVEHHPILVDVDYIHVNKLKNFCIKNKINVLHAHELKACTNALLAGTMARTTCKITHIHTPMSEWQLDSDFKKLLNPVKIKSYALLVNMFGSSEIALTQSRKFVKQREGIKENKVVVIPNGIDTDRFDTSIINHDLCNLQIRDRYKIPEDAYVIGNVSRMTSEKGHKILLDAFNTFCKKLPTNQRSKIYLLLAGGGVLEPSLKDIATEYGLKNNIIFTGVFPKEDLPKFYNVFNLFVFPSVAEGFGIVLIEAMYYGLPVIASNLEVLKEVGADTIDYFSVNASSELAEKLNTQYQQFILRGNEINSPAVDRVKKLYTIEKFTDTYEKLYTRFVETKL